jgi:hypothetical protein
MQYTGIKDKSGKEIYEGDIIAVGMNIKGFNGHILTVRYEDDLAAFNLSIVFDYCDEKLLEVIGNMYENPELIEVKK